MNNLFWLPDDQMARVRSFFPKSHGRPRGDDSRVLSGIIFINRNGLWWCDAPVEYGLSKTLYDRCPEACLSAVTLAAPSCFGYES